MAGMPCTQFAMANGYCRHHGGQRRSADEIELERGEKPRSSRNVLGKLLPGALVAFATGVILVYLTIEFITEWLG